MEDSIEPKSQQRIKPFRQYFFEGLMIFLAVTLGFFAESLRENISNRNTEKELLSSMIEDLKIDTANYQKAIIQNKRRMQYLDTLITACYAFREVKQNHSEIYAAFAYCRKFPDLVTPSQRTLSQLKNAGGMRLLQYQLVANDINNYDDFGVKLLNQQTYYERTLNEMLDYSNSLLDMRPYTSLAISRAEFDKSIESAILLTNDKKEIFKFGNMVISFRGKVQFYIVRLEAGKLQATQLIDSIKTTYSL
jgi:hypothetical protein